MPCAKCRQMGHNSRTCKNVVPPDTELTPAQDTELTPDAIQLLEPIPIKPKKNKETKYYCYILGQSKQIQKGLHC